MKHIVFYSGGIASYCVAKRVISEHGQQNVILLFTDTNYEHEDLYRFLDESCAKLGVPLTRIADGRTPWEVFRDVRFLGNTRADPCSKILKRDLAKNWVHQNHPDPTAVTLYLGLAHDERHRLDRSKRFWAPYTVESPIVNLPSFTKNDMTMEVRMDGLDLPELYDLGFPHNNCGGFCVKAGQAHFLHLLKVMPEKYAEVEAKEEEMRQLLGDVAILRDRRGGETKPLPLKVLRQRERSECNLFEWGGCGCFGDDNEEMETK
jgi:3'-phosphoadenosine 5'-phosphosulfate sulfotransferase (PAPS reductase)/FAD synthetase